MPQAGFEPAIPICMCVCVCVYIHFTILLGTQSHIKYEYMRNLGRPSRRWEDNIRMDRREIEREVVDWIHLAQNRDQWRALMKTVMNLWVP
jgi:hypothetical protein